MNLQPQTVYVPVEDSDICIAEWDHTTCQWVLQGDIDRRDNVIVMNVEEFRKFMDDAWYCARREGLLEDFLTSEGVEI